MQKYLIVLNNGKTLTVEANELNNSCHEKIQFPFIKDSANADKDIYVNGSFCAAIIKLDKVIFEDPQK